MKKLCNLVVAAAFIATSVAAYAAVNVDEEGKGFVGKGDVQLAFDWNNAQLQENAHLLEFRYTSSEEVSWECEWYTGPDHNRKRHEQLIETSQNVNKSIGYDARKNKVGQITGFNLDGFESGPTTTVTGDEYSCEGNKTYVEGSYKSKVVDEGSLKVWHPSEGEKDLSITQ